MASFYNDTNREFIKRITLIIPPEKEHAFCLSYQHILAKMVAEYVDIHRMHLNNKQRF